MTSPFANSRSDRAGCDSNEADSAKCAPGWELPDFHPDSGHLHTCNQQVACGCASALLAVAEDLAARVDWSTTASGEQHDHPREPGMVLGTRCNVCADPLDDGSCPLCATCCEQEPNPCPRCGKGNSGEHRGQVDCLDGPDPWSRS